MPDPNRPGALPLRPLTTGELLDAAVVLLRTRTTRLLVLGFVFALAEQALLFPLRRLADVDASLQPGTGKLAQFGNLIVIGFGTEAFIIALLGAFAALEAPRALLGTAAPPRRPRMRVASVLVVAVVAGIACALAAWPFEVVLVPLQSAGITVAVLLTIFFWPVAYGLVGLMAPAVVIDGMGAPRAFLRSLRLSTRNGMRAAFIRVLGYLAWLIIRSGLILGLTAIVALAFSSPSPTVDNIVLGGAALVVNTLAYPVLGCLDVILHLETRMRTEGLDIALRRSLHRGVATENALAIPVKAKAGVAP